MATRPTERLFKTKGRPVAADVAGPRDRALLVVGLVAALRRSELADLELRDVDHQPSGIVLTQPGHTLEIWPTAARLDDGPVFSAVSGNRARDRG